MPPRPPAFPQTCNITYAPQQAFYWYYQFLRDNAPCLSDFSECIQVNSTTPCYSPCTTDASDLADACASSVYCNIDGVSGGVEGHPPFEFHSATCAPAACDDGYHDQLLASLQYALCGNLYWTPGYCESLTLTCAYQLKSSSIWEIVGISVGVFVGLLSLCVAAYCIYRCKRQGEHEVEDIMSEDRDESDSVDESPSSRLLQQQQQQFERWSATQGDGSVNRETYSAQRADASGSTTAYTMAELPPMR